MAVSTAALLAPPLPITDGGGADLGARDAGPGPGLGLGLGPGRGLDGGSPADLGTAPDGGQVKAAAPAPTATPPAAHAAPVKTTESREFVIRALLGLLVLLVLAFLGGHPKVQSWERALGVSQVITAGFPFVLLGLLAGSSRVGVLNDKVLDFIDPLLRFGLGWIGLTIGFRIDGRLLFRSQKVTRLLTARVSLSFLCIVASSAVVLLEASGFTRQSLFGLTFLRDAVILGSAGALTSLFTPQLLSASGCDNESIRTVGRLVRLQELVGVIGLLFVAAYFRPSGGHVLWVLPGSAWLLLTLGLGTAVGLLMYAVLQRDPTNVGEAMVLLLGSVAFSGGMAASLRLSPVVVCFVAGTLLANFPGEYKQRVRDTLRRLERPIYLLFLLVVGAQWQVSDRRGWLLMGVFVLARLLGNWLGTRVALRAMHVPLALPAQRALSISPMGALSIAIVVNAQLLYPESISSALVTAIVGGAIATEIIVQLLTRLTGSNGAPSPPPEPTAPKTVGGEP